MKLSKRKVSQMTATAYHEAGHAVVCHRLGIRVKRITIVPSDTNAGMCTHDNILRGINPAFDGSDRCRMRLERLIKVSLAGQAAQRIWRPRSIRRYHSRSDFRLAAELALRVCGTGSVATAYLRWLSLSTEQMLRSSRPLVETLASDLVQHGTIILQRPTLAQPATKFFWK
jgi:ATP-dependent Zn protease